MDMKQQSAGREGMLARRAQVAHLLLAGSPQRLIAKQIGVSAATVNSDARALREQWRAEALADIERYVGESSGRRSCSAWTRRSGWRWMLQVSDDTNYCARCGSRLPQVR